MATMTTKPRSSRPIFHSLGSNYSKDQQDLANKQARRLVRLWLNSLSRSVLGWPKPEQALPLVPDQDQQAWADVTSHFARQFDSQAFLFYKGRDAITFALEVMGVGQGDLVLTQAFSCHAIEAAILRVGAKPVYVDVAKDSLNLSPDTLNKAKIVCPEPDRLKAVLVQHTFGVPADIKEIKAWCRRHKLLLIEDLAQAYGAYDQDGKQLGSEADSIILSFGRDKIIDTVTGGACLFRDHRYHQTASQRYYQYQTKLPPTFYMLRDLIYPKLATSLRHNQDKFLGKLLFRFLKQLKLFTSPTESLTSRIKVLPPIFAPLIRQSLNELKNQLKHRRLLANYYYQALNKASWCEVLVDESQLEHASMLRFPIIVKDPNQLAARLKDTSQYFLTDRWYRQPVDVSTQQVKSLYQQGSCPRAEFLSQHIFNLPTHIQVNTHDVEILIKSLEEVLAAANQK